MSKRRKLFFFLYNTLNGCSFLQSWIHYFKYHALRTCYGMVYNYANSRILYVSHVWRDLHCTWRLVSHNCCTGALNTGCELCYFTSPIHFPLSANHPQYTRLISPSPPILDLVLDPYTQSTYFCWD